MWGPVWIGGKAERCILQERGRQAKMNAYKSRNNLLWMDFRTRCRPERQIITINCIKAEFSVKRNVLKNDFFSFSSLSGFFFFFLINFTRYSCRNSAKILCLLKVVDERFYFIYSDKNENYFVTSNDTQRYENETHFLLLHCVRQPFHNLRDMCIP